MHNMLNALGAVSGGVDFRLSFQAAAAVVGGLAYGLLPEKFGRIRMLSLVTFGAGMLSFLMRV